MKNSEIVNTFGPQEDPYTEIEYLDLMEFLFEEYDSSDNIRAIVKSSEIVINLKVDGEICRLSEGSFSGSVAEGTGFVQKNGILSIYEICGFSCTQNPARNKANCLVIKL